MELVGSGLRTDAIEEGVAEFRKAGGSTVVGLAFRGLCEEALEVGGADGFPVGGVMAGGDGDNLQLTRVLGNF